ncbi:MAG: ABC transporter substrate-binding protein [Thermodesulfobacteriota bacterium]
MRMRKDVLLAVGLLVSIFLIYGSFSHAKDVRGVTDKLIKIGTIMDHTGPAASSTVPMDKGIQHYARYINELGGIHGRKLQIISEDDHYSIPTAVAAYKKLVFKDKIFSLIGPGSGSFVPPLVNRWQNDKLPTMCLPFTELAVEPFKKYVFIAVETYERQMMALTDYLVKDYKLKNLRIGLVHPDTEAGKGDAKAVLSRLKEYNIEPVTEEITIVGGLDVSTQVMSLKRKNVNCVMNVGVMASMAVTLLRDLKKFGLKVPVFSNWAIMLSDEVTELGDAAGQSYISSGLVPWYAEGPGVEEMRKVTLRYLPGADKAYGGTGHTYGWGKLRILSEGIRRAGKDLDEDGLIKALESLNNYDTGGVLAPITYTSKSHRGAQGTRIYRVDPLKKKFIPVTEWKKVD